MAVADSDIAFYLTGAVSDGAAQSDPDASLGSYRSSSLIVDDTLENLYDNVSNAERVAGDIEYRCFCIKNTHSTDSILNAIVWIETDTGNVQDDISFAVEVPTGGDQTGYAQSIVDESTGPNVGSGNVSSWSDSTSKGTGVAIDIGAHDENLDAGEILFVWLRRTITAGASGATDSVTIRVEGDS